MPEGSHSRATVGWWAIAILTEFSSFKITICWLLYFFLMIILTDINIHPAAQSGADPGQRWIVWLYIATYPFKSW